jgi:hypothetical protein
MSRETKKLSLSPSMFDKLTAMLRAGTQVEDAGAGEVLFQETVQFSGDVEMDIKVVNSEDGPWTEGVLFCGGSEVSPTEVGDELAGEYIVPYMDKEFCVVVERSTTAPPVCPRCGNDMDEVGSVGIVHNDGEWDAEVERYDCPEGHTIFVAETDRIDPEEADRRAYDDELYAQSLEEQPEAVCENCGAPCVYDEAMCLCDKCELLSATDGDECPICGNGTVEVVGDETRCKGECGTVARHGTDS